MATFGRAGRVVTVLAIGLAVAAVTIGCGQQQLEERNLALEKQLRQALAENADLQAQDDTLKAQNAALAADLDKARGALATAKAPAGAPAAPAKPPRAKPEFGEGVETAVIGEATYITLPDAVLFDSGKAALKTTSRHVLDKIIGVLNKDYAGDTIRVEGHTDSDPINKSKKYWDDNWDLSCNRAMAVLRYMTSKGIEAKRIYAAGFGPYKSVATNNTAPGRAKNRRVVIVVFPQSSGPGGR
jgi:chemotaxis protein MotB